MRPVYVIKEFLNSIQESDFTNAESLITNTFKLDGFEPDSCSGKEYLNVMRSIIKGIPDFKYNYQNFNEKGNTVNFTINVTGTNNREIPSLWQGVEAVKPTNIKVRLPQENVWATFKDNKIDTITIEKVEGGGLEGIYQKLGVTLHLELH